MDEVLLIDKPKGWTSFDVVAKIRGELRRQTGQKIKVGHSGTLDPMATGLLIILIGNATKRQDEFMKKDKVYEAEITFGATSTTDDAEGELNPMSSTEIDETRLKQALNSFVGEIEQMPPQFSAIKIQGKKAYELARAGQKAELKSRLITVYSLQLTDYNWPVLKIICHVSSGTYIRSLARDLGEKLGCGGYLSALRRTKIGQFDVNDSKSVEEYNLGQL